MSTEVLPLLTEAVNELTRSHTHREQVSRHDGEKWVHTKHVTHVPPLLDQLRQAVEPSSSADSGKSKFGSRSPARDDAIDTLRRIESSVDDWLVRKIGHDSRGNLDDDLRALVGVAGSLDEQMQWDLTKDARRWALAARITTGWETPAFQPDNSCPICGERGGLRVRMGDGVTSSDATGLCVKCQALWEPENVGLLAEHIRAENDTVEDPAKRLARLVDQHWPRQGPCLVCGVPGEDARHRRMDSVAGEVAAGADEGWVAEVYGVTVEAVLVAVEVAERDTPNDENGHAA